jgi:hypothetical protein
MSVKGGEGRFFFDFSKLTKGFSHHLPHTSTIKEKISIKIYEKSSFCFLIFVLKNVDESFWSGH